MEDEKLKLNQSRIRKLEIAMALLALTFYGLCLASASAFAQDGVHGLKPEPHNGDYLKVVAGAPTESSLNNQIFDKTISNEMTQKFNAFNTGYEMRQAYQLNGPADYANYQKSNQDLAEWTIKKLLQYHFEKTIKSGEESAQKNIQEQANRKDDQTAAKAVIAISKVQRAISNTTIDMGQDTKTRFKYDFPSGVMRVGMTGPIVDATMDYRIKAADPVIGAVSQPERLSLGMSKNFVAWRASAAAHYALLNGTVNCGVNKQLVGPLSAQVDQSHNLRDTSKDETLYRVNIGLNF
ncbi:MAG: hypothetical protein HY074_07690 [Deltaproteobacteria bacterium]|nr:hypothetical protein [Deltaproteobacteria bacterium]